MSCVNVQRDFPCWVWCDHVWWCLRLKLEEIHCQHIVLVFKVFQSGTISTSFSSKHCFVARTSLEALTCLKQRKSHLKIKLEHWMSSDCSGQPSVPLVNVRIFHSIHLYLQMFLRTCISLVHTSRPCDHFGCHVLLILYEFGNMNHQQMFQWFTCKSSWAGFLPRLWAD